ncbi:MAG TPA: hypothetical protein VGT42_06125, partial [Gammaproteobacteria bacterium]|nr:hypothetical protein [Gammaproteobacteria bacterium]
MVAVALKERAAQDQGWQPDRRTTAVLAFLAAILLCLGFLGLLYRPAQPTLDRHATPLFLQTLPALKTIRHQFKHTVRPRALTPMTVQSLRIPAPTVLETLQDLLYIGTK